MAVKNGIYKLKPATVPKPWGGGHLDRLAGNLSAENIGEYVLFSDLDQFPVQVECEGELKPLGKFWADLKLSYKEIPFMLKILSTAQPISLQNHPSDADIAPLGLRGEGKFECWTILESDPDARAYLGLKSGENTDILRTLEKDPKPLSHFNETTVSQGDVIRLDPGLVHSTTGRLLFYEIQQKSDHTFRIFDFGRGRELHINQAIHCMKGQEPRISNYSAALNTEKFRLEFRSVNDVVKFTPKGSEFSVVTWLGKAAQITSLGGAQKLEWGDSLLVLGNEEITVQKVNAPPSGRITGLPMIDMLFEAYV